jgi:hypothetical protein
MLEEPSRQLLTSIFNQNQDGVSVDLKIQVVKVFLDFVTHEQERMSDKSNDRIDLLIGNADEMVDAR